MIKWDLILGEETFFRNYHAYRPYEQDMKYNQKLQQIIAQHHIVLNSTLLLKYEKYFMDHNPDEYESLVTFFDMIPSYENDTYKYIELISESDATMEEIFKNILSLAGLQKPLIICDSQEQYRQCLPVIKEELLFIADQVLDASITNRIYRNSIIFSKDLLPEDYNDYITWLSEIFAGEKSIDIIDPYFATHRGLENFSNYYLSHIEEGSVINVFTFIKDETSPLDWKRFKNKVGTQIEIYIYKISKKNRTKIHDRRIFLNNSGRHISIGHGLDTLRERDQTMEDCHITIDDDMVWMKHFKAEYKHSPYDYQSIAAP